MNILQRIATWVVDCWRLVMDARYNPLKYIPDPSLQSYFTLVLFVMWSVYFGFLAIFYMGWMGYDIVLSIIIHMLVLIPVMFTNAVFMDAERNGARWLKDIRTQQDIEAMDKRLKRRNYEKRIKWDLDREA